MALDEPLEAGGTATCSHKTRTTCRHLAIRDSRAAFTPLPTDLLLHPQDLFHRVVLLTGLARKTRSHRQRTPGNIDPISNQDLFHRVVLLRATSARQRTPERVKAIEAGAPTVCMHVVSGSISLPSRGSFRLSLTVLVHYRSITSI